VSPSGTPVAGPATGWVVFYDNGSYLGSAELVDGMASFTTQTLSVGAHAMTATYSGDDTFSGSSSSPLAQAVLANAPVVTLTASSS
jgi:hypothetical protein